MMMKVQQMFMLLALALSLAACGVGDADAPSASPNPPTVAPATIEPTAEPLSATGGTVSDTTIPAPPNSAQVERGADPIVDAMVDGLEAEMPTIGAEQGVTLESPVVYKSTDDVATVESFYRQVMPDRGWIEAPTESQDGTAVLAYESGANGAIILAMDMLQFSGTGTLVFTIHTTQ